MNSSQIIHIAGTKGKGSTSHYLARLLELSQDNPRIGLYTSPHIYSITERIQINGCSICEEEFSDLVESLQVFFIPFDTTYFDALTLIAMVYFKQKNCQWIVLETGLGGRFDSTNFCDPVLSIITPVGFDHTQVLGKTLENIANEKAGIIKPGKPVLSAAQEQNVLKVIESTSKIKNSALWYFDDYVHYDIISRSENGSVWNASIKTSNEEILLQNIQLNQTGDIFIENFLLSCLGYILVCKNTLEIFKIISQTALSTYLPCRIEKKGNFIFDVSHNDASLEVLFKTLQSYFIGRKFDLYIGILADKELERIVDIIKKYSYLFGNIIVFDFESSRPSGGKILFDLLGKIKNLKYFENPSKISPNLSITSVFTGSFQTISKLTFLLEKH